MNQFKITIQEGNNIEVLYKKTSTEAFDVYFDAKYKGYKACVFNEDGILIAGIWR